MFKLNLFDISENEDITKKIYKETTWWYNFGTFCGCWAINIPLKISSQHHGRKFYSTLSEYGAKFITVEGFGIYDSYITFEHEEDMTRFLLKWS